MADFTVSRIPELGDRGLAGSNGILPDFRKRLLGDTGALAPGIGAWIRVPENAIRIVHLYSHDLLAATAIGSPIVEIHGASDLHQTTPDLSPFVLLGTLNSAVLKLLVTEPWSYMRAKVTTAGAVAVQVGLVCEHD